MNTQGSQVKVAQVIFIPTAPNAHVLQVTASVDIHQDKKMIINNTPALKTSDYSQKKKNPTKPKTMRLLHHLKAKPEVGET